MSDKFSFVLFAVCMASAGFVIGLFSGGILAVSGFKNDCDVTGAYRITENVAYSCKRRSS